MTTNWHYYHQALANHNVSRNLWQIPDGVIFPRNTSDQLASHNLFHSSAHTYNDGQTAFNHSEHPYNYQPTSEYVDDIYVATDLANYRNSSQSRNVLAPHNLYHNSAKSSSNHIEDPYLWGSYFLPTTEFIDGVYVTTQNESNDESEFIRAYITALNHSILNRIQDHDIITPFSGQQEEEVITKCMRTRTYCGSTSKVEVNAEGEICVICQGEYVNDEIIGKLECGHEYHIRCIMQWLLRGKKKTCPICRSEVLENLSLSLSS